MKYTIKLSNNNNLTGIYLSIPFVNGIGETDNDFIADKAKLKGFEVESVFDINSEDKKIQCTYCKNQYKTQEGLERHIAEKHFEHFGDDGNV